MTNSNVAMYIQTIQGWPVQIANADGQNIKTILTAGAQGSRLTALLVTSSDTSARDVQLVLTRSGTSYILATVSIPATAGTVDSIPTVSLLSSAQISGLALDSNGNPYIDFKAADVLGIEALTTVTSGKIISVTGYGGDF